MKTDFNPIWRAASQLSQRSLSRGGSKSTQPWQTSRFKRTWDRLAQYFLGNPEPQITLKRDRSGEHYWVVYDPTENRSCTLSSAHEVRVWLEERYRR